MKSLIFALLTAFFLHGASLVGSPNTFSAEYESYLISSQVFPTVVSVGMFSALFTLHVSSQKSRWYRQLEQRIVQEQRKRAVEERKKRQAELGAKAKAEEEKRAAEKKRMDEEESKRRAAAEKAAQARRAEAAAKIELDEPKHSECPICLEDTQTYAACESLHRYCSSCLKDQQNNINGCSVCRTPYIISQRLKNIWNPLNNVD